MKGARVYLRGIFKVPHVNAPPPGQSNAAAGEGCCNKKDPEKMTHDYTTLKAQPQRKGGKKKDGCGVKERGNTTPRVPPSATWSGQWGMDPSHFDQHNKGLTSAFSYSCQLSSAGLVRPIFSGGACARRSTVQVRGPDSSTRVDEEEKAAEHSNGFLGSWMRIQGSFDVRGVGGVVAKVIREQSASMCIDSNAKSLSHHASEDASTGMNSQTPSSGACDSSSTTHGVQGFGRNEFGQFTLSGTFNSTTGELNVVKEYQGPDYCPSGRALHLGELYSLVQKSTGCLGGNGAGGAIYGEVTRHSFQRIVDTMKLHTGQSFVGQLELAMAKKVHVLLACLGLWLTGRTGRPSC